MSLPSIDVNIACFRNITPLLRTLRYSTFDAAEILINAGADVNIADARRITPLHLAVGIGTPFCIAKLLIEKGANINAEDCYLNTPLHRAVQSGRFEMISLLLYYGADADALNESGMSPFMLSIYLEAPSAIQSLLLEYETSYNRVSSDGFSTLLHALSRKSPMICDLLMRGANVNYTHFGLNCLMFSFLFNNNKMFKFIWLEFDYELVYYNLSSPVFQCLKKTVGIWTGMDIWESMAILLNSKHAFHIVNHYVTQHNDILSFVLNTGYYYRFKEEDLYPYICIILSFGVDVYFSDLVIAENTYGHNKIFKMFLQMNILNVHGVVPSLSLFMVDIKRDAYSMLNNYEMCVVWCTLHTRNVISLFRYFTPPHGFRQQLIHFFENQEFPREQLTVLRRKIQRFSVPSLLELSRNTARQHLYYLSNDSSVQFYAILKHSRLPVVIKQIIALEMPIYYV